MSGHPVILLVDDLRQRGVELQPGQGRVRFRPRSAVSLEEVELLARHRQVVLAMLNAECAGESPPYPTDKTDRRLDPFLLSVLSVFPGARVEPGVVDSVSPEAPATRGSCHACGSRQWWRLPPGKGRPKGGPWICATCTAPAPPADAIEWREVADA
jgi:hypothetical protein